MWFYISLSILILIWALSGLSVLLMSKRTYEQGGVLSIGLSVSWWILDAIELLLVVLSSLFGIWSLPINKIFALVSGLIIFSLGVTIMIIGIMEFRSLRRVSGLDVSKLITTGVYRWSRNPQYLGGFLLLLGISLMGRSGLAFLFTIVGIAHSHLLYNSNGRALSRAHIW